jgi:steroid 5-alpha reductase family enzyme
MMVFSGISLTVLPIALALSLAISALGFLRSDWFISIGYGLSISALAVLYGLWWFDALTWVSMLQLGLLFFYGFRLSSHLILRERASSYAAELVASKQRSEGMQGPVKFAIWVTVSALYVLMSWPAAVTLSAPASGSAGVIGVLVMALGVGLEMTADLQKSAAKRRDPGRFVQTGVFAWVRYPNYLGEMLFWLGNFIASVLLHAGWGSWLLAAIGLVCIELIMLGSTRRLEFKQAERYGSDPKFVHYSQTTPVLFPFIPLYSVKRLRVYLG